MLQPVNLLASGRRRYGKLQHVDAVQVGIPREKIEEFDKSSDIQQARVKIIEDRMMDGMETGYISIFQDQLSHVQQRSRELRENADAVNGCIERTFSLLQSEKELDRFTPLYTVPPNPATVLLNYSDC